jgi:hypothetical protein
VLCSWHSRLETKHFPTCRIEPYADPSTRPLPSVRIPPIVVSCFPTKRREVASRGPNWPRRVQAEGRW